MADQPKIVISYADAERLERLLDSLPAQAFPGKKDLERELARAELVSPASMPPAVVTMSSTVKFRVSSSRESFSLRLVYPDEMEPTGTLSIFAPVGSALLGLKEGDTIEWPKPGGGNLEVTIEEVVDQPERSSK